jgi:hypothetical protein
VLHAWVPVVRGHDSYDGDILVFSACCRLLSGIRDVGYLSIERIGGINALFVRFRPIRKFSGFPIIFYYVNFQEFMSIFKGILLQMRKEKGGKVHTFTISIGSRIAGSGFGLEIGRIARYCRVNRRGSGRQVGKGGNIAHVNPAAYDYTAFDRSAQRRWQERAYGSKNNSGIQRFGRRFRGIPGPHRSQPAGKLLRFSIPGTRKCENLLPLIGSHLGNDMGGSAESINSYPLGMVRSHPVGAVPYQSGAQQRCGIAVAVAFRQRETVPPVGNRIFGVPSVDRVSGEERAVA